MPPTKIEWATHSWNPVTGCSVVPSSDNGEAFQRLPCGCVLGFIKCDVARSLWAEASRAYQAAINGTGTWADYDNARARYQEHLIPVPENGGPLAANEGTGNK